MTKEKTFSATRFPFLSVTVGINGNLTHMSDRLKELSAQTYTNSKGHRQFFCADCFTVYSSTYSSPISTCLLTEN